MVRIRVCETICIVSALSWYKRLDCEENVGIVTGMIDSFGIVLNGMN